MSAYKKIFHYLSSVLLYSIFALLIIIVVMFGAYYIDQQIGLRKNESRSPLFGAYVIISESMIPNIKVYDAVVTMRVKEDKIKVDDIITFISKNIETAGTPITHRVVGIVTTSNGEVAYRTKGDNNNTPDSSLILHSEMVGKVLFRIPKIGYIQTFMTHSSGWLFIVVIPCLLIVGFDVFKLIKAVANKGKDNDTEERDIQKKDKELILDDPFSQLPPVEDSKGSNANNKKSTKSIKKDSLPEPSPVKDGDGVNKNKELEKKDEEDIWIL